MKDVFWATLAAATALTLSGCQNGGHNVLRIGIAALENQADRTVRYEPLGRYLERTLNVRLEIRNAADYAGVIEALRSSKIDMAYFGAPHTHAHGRSLEATSCRSRRHSMKMAKPATIPSSRCATTAHSVP